MNEKPIKWRRSAGFGLVCLAPGFALVWWQAGPWPEGLAGLIQAEMAALACWGGPTLAWRKIMERGAGSPASLLKGALAGTLGAVLAHGLFIFQILIWVTVKGNIPPDESWWAAWVKLPVELVLFWGVSLLMWWNLLAGALLGAGYAWLLRRLSRLSKPPVH
ncbi:MAG: hypothetical protein OEV94_03320 [Deltaproteobacteria bacterium]|nr:hypothetical protein [Deltaproteobacteria bacterium]